MVDYFITVLNGVITGSHCGDINCDFFGTEFYGHDRVKMPESVYLEVRAFDRVDFYNENWVRKPDVQLIDEGKIPMPQGYVREGDALRKMAPEERILAGLDAPPFGHKVENGEIVPMTLEEQAEAGLVTQAELDQRKAEINYAELQRRLSDLLAPVAVAEAELDPDGYGEARKAQMAALIAVKQQQGWPLIVKWPEEFKNGK